MLSRPARAFRPGKGSGQKQTKYESETLLRGLRFANKASRIFVQTGAEAFRIVASSFVRSFPAPPLKRVVVRQAGKASANQSLASRQDWLRIVALSDRRQVRLPKPSAPRRLPAPIRDEGEETGDKQGRNRRRANRAIRRGKGNADSARRTDPCKVMVAKGLSPADGSASAPVPAAPEA